MSVREYIGARYVPLFADPIEWDNTKTYEPLTIVYYQGNSYTSRQAVPTGIAITNETYWALTGNYNAQIEAYREEVTQYAEEVAAFDGRLDDIEDALPESEFDSTNTVKARFEAIEAKFPVDKNDVKKNVLYKPSDPMFYGADNTGTESSSDAIEDCIEANFGKTIVFTPGIYKITRPIKTPYTAANRVSIDFNGSVIIYDGLTSQSAALEIGTYEGDNSSNIPTGSTSNIKNYYSNFSLSSNQMCTSAIYIETHYMNANFENFVIATHTNGITIGNPNDSNGYPTDAYFGKGFINAYYHNNTQIGVDINGTDNTFDTVRVYNFRTYFNVKRGGNSFNKIHTLGITTDTQNGISFLIDNGLNNFNDIYNDTVATAFKITYNNSFQMNQITNFRDYSYNSSLANRTFIHIDGLSDCPNISVDTAMIAVNDNYTGFKATNLSGGVTTLNRIPARISFDNIHFNKNVSTILNDTDLIRSAKNLLPNEHYTASVNSYELQGTLIFTDQYKPAIIPYCHGNESIGAFTASRTTTDIALNRLTASGSAMNFGTSVISNPLIPGVYAYQFYVNKPSNWPTTLITDYLNRTGWIFLPKYIGDINNAITGTPEKTVA